MIFVSLSPDTPTTAMKLTCT